MNNQSTGESAPIIDYLQERGLFTAVQSLEPLRNGASGAKVYRVIDQAGSYVVKHTHPSLCGGDQHLLSSYERELRFYSVVDSGTFPAVPQALHVENNPELGFILVLPNYERIEFDQWSPKLQERAAELCAQIHSLDPACVESLGLEFEEITVDTDSLDQALENWIYVLNRHCQQLDTKPLQNIRDSMSSICSILNAPPHRVCHGDFHAENLLLNQGDLVICDWQNVNIGKGAGDISFFISRGKAAGIDIDAAQLIDRYCEKLSFYTKQEVEKKDIYDVINASTVHISFRFWPHYLRDAKADRVFQIYDAMVEAYLQLGL